MGYPQSHLISIALDIAEKRFKKMHKEEKLLILKKVLQSPSNYVDDPDLGTLAKRLTDQVDTEKEVGLKKGEMQYKVFGGDQIDFEAKRQLEVGMRLPIAVQGALMPDAHPGYGLPIGGVLATENAVIPYGVGVDIGCRMALSIFNIPGHYFQRHAAELKRFIEQNTAFGPSKGVDRPMDDPIFEREAFRILKPAARLKSKAYQQIGSSGSGNHFVEFGKVTISDAQNEFGLPTGDYLGLLSHSGSRGLGAGLAQHYTKIAMKLCRLPREAKQLAWLSLDSEEGKEYWMAMTLAGDYARACHQHIHKKMAKALREKPVAVVENHHNFAWKETLQDGREVVVHRKGATPAGKGVLGIIPGSMADPGYIVRGMGSTDSLQSASHGAGRLLSRKAASNSFTKSGMRQILAEKGITLIGGGTDEAPGAYKPIGEVMRAQQDLVEIVGKFQPKIVRMDK